MPVQINVSIKGLDEAKALLNAVQKGISDFKPELKSVGEYLESFYPKYPFDTEGSVFGVRWKSLSPRYFAKKSVEFPGRPILVRTGALQKSFQLMTTGQYLTFKNTAAYAGYLQEGTSRMPARPFLVVDQQRADKISEVFVKHLKNRIINS